MNNFEPLWLLLIAVQLLDFGWSKKEKCLKPQNGSRHSFVPQYPYDPAANPVVGGILLTIPYRSPCLKTLLTSVSSQPSLRTIVRTRTADVPCSHSRKANGKAEEDCEVIHMPASPANKKTAQS